MDQTIEVRSVTSADVPFLWEVLYHALYVPPGHPPFPRQALREPEIARYVAGWGREGDLGCIALICGNPVGAAWIRLWAGEDRGFGCVDAATPELSIAMLPGYRGRGIGGRLLAHLLAEVQSRYAAVSLSVSPGNPALRLYRRFGFEVVEETPSSLTMVKRWA